MKSLPPSADPQLFMASMGKEDFLPNVSMQRQLANHVRQLVLKGKLPVGARLPSMRSLAKLWGTSYFPVHGALRSLAREGLLEQGTKQGTFVAARERALHRVCLYHNEHSLANSGEFYSLLNTSLYRLLSNRGVVTIPYFDSRQDEEKGEAPPEIREMIRHREIDAVIATSILPHDTVWMLKIGIPISTLMMANTIHSVEMDVESFVQRVIKMARKGKRRQIGLICPPLTKSAEQEVPDRLFEALKKTAASFGMTVNCPELPSRERKMHWGEQEGDYLCEKLLTSGQRPDLIVVFPDIFMRGVSSALVRHRVDVPADIMVVSHRNLESLIYIPFPMNWLTVKIADFAAGMMLQIERQVAGEKARPVLIPVGMEKTGFRA